MFQPFCKKCYEENEVLEFTCIQCDKLELIGKYLQEKEKQIADMATIAAQQIMQNYEQKRRENEQTRCKEK